ncbi:phospholipase D-like domain-containing protein [Elongatibacter sediminis]|uniref:phospholipase D n=1 Tax=Elongatibacter sediminis TaxID=3119006 RepID=A0AAW9RFK8_9GAMM
MLVAARAVHSESVPIEAVPMTHPQPFAAHFGGPDQAPDALRDLLARRLAAVPAGGRVDWVTYYFRDRELARELVRARQRGVTVNLVLEGRPRVARANEAVIRILRGSPGGENGPSTEPEGTGREGLGNGLRLLAARGILAPRGLAWKPQVHEKIYCFSHPEPVAFVGSFNPSGDRPEDDPEVVRRIGDHRVAHNALVEVRDPALVDCLGAHVRQLQRNGSWLFRRGPAGDHEFDTGSVYFWPRRGPHPVEAMLESMQPGSRVRIAASHIRNPGSVACLCRLARRGVEVEVTAEHTRRRVPPRMERRLVAAGIGFTRLGADADVPMHLKFVLADGPAGRRLAFGSFNWTRPSYYLNHEVAVITGNEALWSAFDARWRELAANPAVVPPHNPAGHG